ncbi:MAG: transglutaminase-like domain-containing protein [Tannerellaceae bacterium]|nr:transglutaminase-like domain-containing protein [Tannerellaceae bacterium]
MLRNPKDMKSANNISIINKHLEEIQILFHSTGYILTQPPWVSRTSSIIQVSFYPDESIRFRVKGTNIIVDNLPNNDRWSYVMLSLRCDTDRDLNETVFPGRQTVIYPTGHLPDGYYYLSLYTSHDENTAFSSYISDKDLVIYKQRNSISFLQAPVLDHNVMIYLNNRTDRRALEFYLQPTSEFPANDPNIVALANNITQGASNDYGKAKAIHDWVCNNIWYDWDSFLSDNIKGVSTMETIRSRKSVCEGYAYVTATLLRAVGIPAKKVVGYALGVSNQDSGWTSADVNNPEGNHAWNEAFIDGDWIIIDTTWDSNNKFQNRRFSTGTGLQYYRYFDASIEMFSMDHKIFKSEEIIE